MQNYHTDSYLILAIHEMIKSFNPYTDNIIISDILSDNNIDKKIITNLIHDVDSCLSGVDTQLPISYRYILYKHAIAWCTIINSLLFEDKSYNLFYGEYRDTIEKIINSTSIDSPNSVIYREYKSGSTIFHTAAKLRLLNVLKVKTKLPIGSQILLITDEYEKIKKCYAELGKLCDNGDEFSINYIKDFSGSYLINSVKVYADELIENYLT